MRVLRGAWCGVFSMLDLIFLFLGFACLYYLQLLWIKVVPSLLGDSIYVN